MICITIWVSLKKIVKKWTISSLLVSQVQFNLLKTFLISTIYYFSFCFGHYFYPHAYIIGHYNPSVRITAKLLTPFILCVLILSKSKASYSLTSTPNDRFLRGTFSWQDLFTLRVLARNLLRGNRRRNIFFLYFVLNPDLLD